MSRITINANGIYPGHKLRGKERYAKLYHYTSFESFVKIWLSKTLKFSSVKNVNDVLESAIKTQAATFPQMPLMDAYIDIRPQFRQISLTMDYDSYVKGCMSPCMWGYYADKKKGVCIELDYDKLPFSKSTIKGPVIYKEDIPDATYLPAELTTINQLLSFMRKNARREFLTKHISWKGENEYRIVSREDEFLDISQAITAVYLTSYDSDECIFVEKLVGDAVPVKYLHYISEAGTGYVRPVMTNTKSIRQQWEAAKNNPDNALVMMTDQARAFYDQHKDDPDYPLIIKEFRIK